MIGRTDKRYILILDGWDELSLVPDQSLATRVGHLLEKIRFSVLARSNGYVSVVLTGRPSHLVTRSQNMTAATPILTIRPFTPAQLRTYFEKLDGAYSASTERPFDFQEVLQRYEQDWNSSQTTHTLQHLELSTSSVGRSLLIWLTASYLIASRLVKTA